MQFSLIDESEKQSLIFPISPEILNVQMGAKTMIFEPISLGDVELPRGRTLVRISWEGFLPGVNQNVPSRYSNLKPNDIVEQLRRWSEGRQAKKLRLIITGTSWNLPVFLTSFEPSYSGGTGDITYTIGLTEWREMIVQEKKVAAKPPPKRPVSKPATRTYTVKKGDTLWGIARKYTGKGIRWTEMWAINKSKSRSKNPNLIYPGEKFTIPSGW